MRVVSYKKPDTEGSILAFVSLEIEQWKMIIHNCKLIRTKNGHTFVSLPQYSQEVNGERKYFPYVEFSKEADKRFQEAAKKSINDYALKHQRQTSPQPTQQEIPF
jgi:DNA-binding cell septation regulator SpoVG